MYRPFRPIRPHPLAGALLLTVAALLISGNTASPPWLRTLIWIGLTLYNTLWWLLQVPTYQTFQKYALPPEKQSELAHWRRVTFATRLLGAFFLALISGIMFLVVRASPEGAASQSLGLYELVLLIALSLGVLAEWRRYFGKHPTP